MIEKKEIDTGKAVLVGIATPEVSDFEMTDNLDELAFLAETASIKEEGRFVQRLDTPNGATFVGKGNWMKSPTSLVKNK